MEKYMIGIDVGGTNTVAGLVSTQGEIVDKCTFLTQRDMAPEDQRDKAPVYFDEYMENLYKCIDHLIANMPKDGELAGIGLGAPNANYFNGLIFDAPNLHWIDRTSGKRQLTCHIVKLIKEHYSSLRIAVAMTNDANAAAMGELYYGGGRSLVHKDLIEVTLGTGLGSGFISNGDIVYGHNSFAGELGHIVVVPDGRLCGCGNSGCLETYGSATGIVRTANQLLASSKWRDTSKLREIINNQKREISCKDVGDAANAGDELALETLDITARYIGLGIATAVAITAPKKVFIFGGPTKMGEVLLKPIRKYFNKFVLNNFRDTEIVFSELPDDAAVMGAAALAANEVKKLGLD
ncbi:MAG: ROK family protein [Tidjanibacter sp.]|nr:ROK family protein [Tidjanibacter sp.]